MTRLVSTSFETGTGSFVSSNTTGEVMNTGSANPYSGSWNLYVSCNGNLAGEMCYLLSSFSPNQALLYSRLYLKVTGSLPTSGNSFNFLTHYGTGGTVAAVRLTNDTGVYVWELFYNSSSTMTQKSYTPASAIALNTYYAIELMTTVGASGNNTVYIDGTSRITTNPIDNDQYGNIAAIHFGERYSSAATAHCINIDDLDVDNASYIGTFTVGGGETTGSDRIVFWEPAKRSGDPTTTGWGNYQAGRIWFNTGSGVIKYWNGSAVKTVTAT